MHSKKETATQPDDRYLKRWNPNEYYKDNSVAKSYDGTRFTSFSGRLFNWLEKRAIRRAFADLPNESRIADIPCGTGRLAEVLLENSHLVTGIDISAAMLSVASERLQRFGSRFSTEVSDARELSKGGERFDAVLCARFLMHFPLDDQLEFVRNVVLASRHRVVLTQGISTPLQRARRALKRLIGRFQAAASFPLTPGELKYLLESAGLREIRRYRPLPLLSESLVVVAERIPARDIKK